jgi:hypothetical protein
LINFASQQEATQDAAASLHDMDSSYIKKKKKAFPISPPTNGSNNSLIE